MFTLAVWISKFPWQIAGTKTAAFKWQIFNFNYQLNSVGRNKPINVKVVMVISHCTALSIIQLDIMLYLYHFVKYEVSRFHNDVGISLYKYIYIYIYIFIYIYILFLLCTKRQLALSDLVANYLCIVWFLTQLYGIYIIMLYGMFESNLPITGFPILNNWMAVLWTNTRFC